jgi:hypothetical protein
MKGTSPERRSFFFLNLGGARDLTKGYIVWATCNFILFYNLEFIKISVTMSVLATPFPFYFLVSITQKEM